MAELDKQIGDIPKICKIVLITFKCIDPLDIAVVF